MKKIQVLAVAVHPDDVELCCSGTLMMEKLHGKTVGVVDLTRGELGTRGTAEIRQQESEAAARIMNLDIRENLGMPDGFFRNDEVNQRKLIRALRKYPTRNCSFQCPGGPSPGSWPGRPPDFR